MCQNPALARALARDRVAELRQAAEAGSRDRRHLPRAHVIQAARRGTGWLLVDVGLRLALPHRGTTHPVRGHTGSRDAATTTSGDHRRARDAGARAPVARGAAGGNAPRRRDHGHSGGGAAGREPREHVMAPPDLGQVRLCRGDRPRTRAQPALARHHDTRSFETAWPTPTSPQPERRWSAPSSTHLSQLREWWSRRLVYPVKWRRAAFMADSVSISPPRARGGPRRDPSDLRPPRGPPRQEHRPAEALPVHLYAHGHPLPPTPSGN